MYLFGRYSQFTSEQFSAVGGTLLGLRRGGLSTSTVSKAVQGAPQSVFEILLTLILVAPFTDFSKELAIANQGNAGRLATACGQSGESCLLFCRDERRNE
jgi:hypothetical protein